MNFPGHLTAVKGESIETEMGIGMVVEMEIGMGVEMGMEVGRRTIMVLVLVMGTGGG